ncbi:MAG: hypothetical protein FWC91_11725, partial [Defluviitaleaceae bacterium]|nr:hypothetical protein [Defluviitaleaceae bacterium]
LDVRSWEDALKYGFISAGGGQWYSGPLNNLEVGNRIWVYTPGAGYVGVGTVTHTAKRASETMISVNGKDENFFDLQLTADYHKGQTADKEEYIVRVKWIKTVSKDEAVLEKNFFSNQNTAARPIADSWHYTIARLKQIWGIDD